MNKREIDSLLASAGLRPQHQFGQNFMIDQTVLAAIADAGEIGPHDVVLEVGPGVGNLTRQLATRAHAGAVLAVDIDRKLMPAAQKYHAALTNVRWLNADVLASKHELNPDVLAALRELRATHGQGELKLVSNLPYNAASPLIAELLALMTHDETLAFSVLAFTVQYEVGLRMAAMSGSDYGPLSVLIALTAESEIVRKIPPGAFWPPPKINSALVRIRPVVAKCRRIKDVVGLQRLLAGLFSHRRQTMHNALKHYLKDAYTPRVRDAIADAKIDLSLRPEAIAPEQFLTIATITQKSE